MAHADLDSPGPLSPMPKDIHCTARLVAAVRDLQPPLPAKSVGVVAPITGSDLFRTSQTRRGRPDPSTVRRWAGRLLHWAALLAAKLWQATGWSASTPPTILAWDWTAIRRILALEARSP